MTGKGLRLEGKVLKEVSGSIFVCLRAVNIFSWTFEFDSLVSGTFTTEVQEWAESVTSGQTLGGR